MNRSGRSNTTPCCSCSTSTMRCAVMVHAATAAGGGTRTCALSLACNGCAVRAYVRGHRGPLKRAGTSAAHGAQACRPPPRGRSWAVRSRVQLVSELAQLHAPAMQAHEARSLPSAPVRAIARLCEWRVHALPCCRPWHAPGVPGVKHGAKRPRLFTASAGFISTRDSRYIEQCMLALAARQRRQPWRPGHGVDVGGPVGSMPCARWHTAAESLSCKWTSLPGWAIHASRCNTADTLNSRQL